MGSCMSANLSGANLMEANLRWANLQGARLAYGNSATEVSEFYFMKRRIRMPNRRDKFTTIEDVVAREILDSRGNPTLEVEVF